MCTNTLISALLHMLKQDINVCSAELYLELMRSLKIVFRDRIDELILGVSLKWGQQQIYAKHVCFNLGFEDWWWPFNVCRAVKIICDLSEELLAA